MSLSLCPIATVNAPLEKVWSLLSEPASYALSWDAETRAIAPAGPAQAGQRMNARSRALGKWWDVEIAVDGAEAPNHQLDLTTQLPFGITVQNHISVNALD
jgi:ligand-binding SRPBCC domain-containing protein